jgi:ribosomal protein S18 acetylase RimI-like enzyme
VLIPELIPEQLAPHHDRKAFDCGDPELNGYLIAFPIDPPSFEARCTYVYVAEPGSPEVVAYQTLSPSAEILLEIAPEDEVEKDVLELKYLAVDKKYQRQGVGEAVLVHVIRGAKEAAEIHSAVHGLMLYAINDKAKRWYLNRGFGFEEIGPNTPYLFLRLK